MATKAEPYRIKLQSEIDSEMMLDMKSINARFRSRLVGVLNDKLLIFHLPEGKIRQALTNADIGQKITVRGISRGEAFGFNAEILACMSIPDHLLMLSYPADIQHQSIRNSRRVKCLLPAKFARDTIGIPGVVSDISNDGCHFQTETKLNSKQSAIVELNSQVLVSFVLPGKDIPKTVDATIRNTFIDTDSLHIGMQFHEVDSVTRKQLDEFIALSFEIAPF